MPKGLDLESCVKNARVASFINTRDHISERSNEVFGEYFDKTEYTDANGVVFYPYMFSKTLEHDAETGFAKKADVQKVVKALETGTVEDLNAICRDPDSSRLIEGPHTALSQNLQGPDSASVTARNFHFLQIDSKKLAFEMMEVYAKALLRDVSFQDYATYDKVATIIGHLNMCYGSDITGPVVDGMITTKTLFRGLGPDETVGPYISQFLLLPFNYGNIPLEQKYEPEIDPENALDMKGWLAQQNGITGSTINKDPAVFNWNGRVLGAKVHNDPLYQFYYNAALIALQQGIGLEGPNVYTEVSNWTDGGGPSMLASVAEASVGALRTAWYAKFNLGMKIRPEVMAQRIHLGKTNTGSLLADVPKLKTICDNANEDILDLVSEANNSALNCHPPVTNYYLDSQFSEGSPTHPAWPAGHATVAGACTTVLKAYLKTHDDHGNRRLWSDAASREAVVAVNDGVELAKYHDSDVAEMTVIGELNKLASNVSLGRDFAGVHFRCDGDCGLKMGEEYAIGFLKDKALEFHSSTNGAFEGWKLEKFDGTTVKITKDSVICL